MSYGRNKRAKDKVLSSDKSVYIHSKVVFCYKEVQNGQGKTWVLCYICGCYFLCDSVDNTSAQCKA